MFVKISIATNLLQTNLLIKCNSKNVFLADSYDNFYDYQSIYNQSYFHFRAALH